MLAKIQLLSQKRQGMHHLDIVTREIIGVECENPADAVDVHGGHEPGVMDLASYDPVPHDEPLPLGVHRRRVGKNLQKPLDFSTSPKTSWTEKPRPLLATGRVATFQNSAMFCSVKYTGSAAASSLAMLS